MARTASETGAVALPCVLAVDVGSSSVRAALYDAHGRAVAGAAAQAPYQFRTTPDGGVEADPAETLRLVAECVDRALYASPHPVSAVGVSTYWHNVLGADAAGRPLTPVYTWADTRAAAAADELAREVHPIEAKYRTGCVIHPSYLPAKLRWLARRDPVAFRTVDRWLSVGEWLVWQFTGARCCSVSMASGTGLINQREADWDALMVEKAVIRRKHLSPIAPDREPAGCVGGAWAERWPRLKDVPWFPALGDGACANVGSGCTFSGRVALSLGTSGAMRVMVDADDVDPDDPYDGLWTYRLDRRRHLLGGALSEGGNLHAWLTETLHVDEDVAFGPPDGHGLTVLPFLAGERSPAWNPLARGAILGLTLHTRPADIVQAGLEAVAYRFGLIHELLGPVMAERRLIVASGAAVAKSAVWGQLLADVFGEPVEESAETEASSRGAALMALAGVGAVTFEDMEAPPAGRRWEPDAERHWIYRAAAERQRRDYDRLFGRRCEPEE